MHILIAFGSKRGGTEELARVLGKPLSEAGHTVDIRPADEPDGLCGWDAVVVGGALYAGRWPRSVRRFVQRHVDELERMPVWFFSSGPLDDSAAKGEIAPTPQVSRLMKRVHARGHVTFGGRLEADAKGFIAHAMVKQGRAGDWRDLEAVSSWGRAVAKELAALPPLHTAAPAAPGRTSRSLRRRLAALCFFTGLTAMAGGIELIMWPTGGPWESAPQPSLLRHSPFFDFFAPGLILFWAVGVLNMLSGVLALRSHRLGEVAAFAAGSSLTIWILSEIALLRVFSWLQGLYLVIGLATMGLAFWLWRRRRAAIASHAGMNAEGKPA